MSSALEDSLISLRRIVRVNESNAKALAKKVDMATSELLTLQMLADTPGMSPGELAKAMGLSPVTSTVILQKLEIRNLIRKVRSESDKRRLEVQLTPQGKAELLNTPSSTQHKFASRFSNLPNWEQHQIAAVLARVTELIEAPKGV